MIQQAELSVETLWQKELKQSFTTPEALLNYLELPVEDFVEDNKARALFAMRVPKPFAQLMSKRDPQDPLLRQVLPNRQEFINSNQYSNDPLNEQNTDIPGLLHKYKSRVLLIFKAGCAVNCRYCFRRQFPYSEHQINKQKLAQHIAYIKQRPEVNEVILSGGDPLMANDQHLAWFIQQLDTIPHLTRLRIHTRLPVVIPNRITTNLLDVLAHSRFNNIIVLHINHPNELSAALIAQCKLIKQRGIWLFNQAVILKGVNDTLEVQVSLSEALFNAGIQPYYLHVLDKVAGASHFDLEHTSVRALYAKMLQELPGFLVPKLVREIGGETSKTPIPPLFK